MRKPDIIASPLAMVANLAIAYLAYMVCRLAFVAENWSMFGENLSSSAVLDIFRGSLLFDTSAILYTNSLYAIMLLIPLHLKEKAGWQKAAKWVFVVVNSLMVAANLADCVYFQYTGRRTTATVFSEFGNEGNIGGIIGVEFLRHWYLVLLFLFVVWALWRLYVIPRRRETKPLIIYYTLQTL